MAAAAGTAALLALVYLLPLRDVPLLVENPSLRLFDAAAVLTLAAGVWLVLGSPRHALPAAPALAFCVFYAQLCLAALLGVRNGGDAFMVVRTLVWPLYCLAVFAAGALLARRHEPGFVLRHLVWGLAAANVVAYALFVFEPHLVAEWAGGMDLSRSGAGAGLRRFPGLASEPNYWGSVHLFLLPLAWATILSEPARARLRPRGLTLAAAALLLAAFATFSTFTHVALLLALPAALSLGGTVRRPWLALGALALGAAAATGFALASGYGEYVIDKLGSLDQLGSAGERLHAAAAAARMWAEAPLFGHGLGTYAVYHNQFSDVPLRPIETAHSVPMATLAEQGLAGLACLAVLLAALLGLGDGSTRRAIGRDPVLRMLFLGLLLYAGYFAITGNLYLYYFWFYCGLFHGLARWARPAGAPAPAPLPSGPVAPAVAAPHPRAPA